MSGQGLGNSSAEPRVEGRALASGSERRYWDPVKRRYIPLEEFGSVSRAVRAAAPDVWTKEHPAEPTLDQRARDIAERLTGMPAYLVDDETWDAAMAEASDQATAGGPVSGPEAPKPKQFLNPRQSVEGT